MIAHSDRELCGTISDIVEAAGYESVLGHNGTEVLALMEEIRPHVAVVDVALQGLYAFEVVDTVRSRPGLDKVKIILLSSVYNNTAYKRRPNSLYGADDYIEKHHISDDLIHKINRQLVGAAETGTPAENGEVEESGQPLSPGEEASQSRGVILSVNERIQVAEGHEVSTESVPESARAERLARIIVADISLYHQQRIDKGILEGRWSGLLAAEMKEARSLFGERFPSPQIQSRKILEAAFLDLLEKRSRELGA
jgi:DNA-binding response OmpR family regulator